MIRPTRKELADRRAEALRFLAANPEHELAPMIRVLVASTAPITKSEAVPVMARHTNEASGWKSDPEDVRHAINALNDPPNMHGSWAASIRAQWATLVHFCGGAKMGHTDPDELLNTIPAREPLQDRHFDPDPDRERDNGQA